MTATAKSQAFSPRLTSVMPLCGRIAGVDICLFGPPAAHNVEKYSSSFASSSMIHPMYPNHSESLTATPKRYRVNSFTKKIGQGRSVYGRAARALETGEAMELPWAKFWRGGNGSCWTSADVLVIAARVIPFVWIANVNTVVHAVRRHSSLTLTWGTTARHVLRGEESVQIAKHRNGDVVFHLRSFSKPHAFIAWITYPLVIYLQHRFARDVANRLDDIANQRFQSSNATLPPIERGKPKQENLRGGRRFRRTQGNPNYL